MHKLGAALALSLLSVVASAHAAPPAPSPAPTPRMPRAPIQIQAAPKVDVEIVPGTGKCGESLKQRVKLTNKSGESQPLVVTFVAAGGQTERSINLSHVLAFALQSIEVMSAKPLDCTKPLGAFEIRVAKEGNPPFLTKSLKLTTLKAEQGFPAPPPNDLAPWLRRVTLDGTCGGNLTAQMGLHTFSPQPKPAKVKLTLGAVTKEETVQVQTTNTFVKLEAPVDCQATIPSFEYALLDGHPASGKLSSIEIGFAPQ